MFGPRLVRAFEEVKDTFDPKGVLNPGKIVRAPRMDDRNLLRFRPDYAPLPIRSGLDWQAWGGFLGAAEMCNNNGACRKAETRRHVPLLPGHPRRDPPHPRPRQQPAPRAQRPARAGGALLGRDGGDPRPLRRLQGLPAGMPDRGRHGADEDRGPASAAAAPRAQPQGPADCLSSALCALRQPRPRAAAPARPTAGCGRAVRAPARLQRQALAAALARAAVSAAREWPLGRRRRARRRPAGRHLHDLCSSPGSRVRPRPC